MMQHMRRQQHMQQQQHMQRSTTCYLSATTAKATKGIGIIVYPSQDKCTHDVKSTCKNVCTPAAAMGNCTHDSNSTCTLINNSTCSSHINTPQQHMHQPHQQHAARYTPWHCSTTIPNKCCITSRGKSHATAVKHATRTTSKATNVAGALNQRCSSVQPDCVKLWRLHRFLK